ncbi:MAG: hypothetical protein Q8T11_06535 [Elusimicrobiota bacterium]|nr:hypothetical protein [Elusimicrobiota bacterium]
MRIALALALLALPLSASASLRKYRPAFNALAATGACPRVDPSHVGNTQGYADGFRSGKCYVSIGSMLVTDLVYKAYGFFSDGMLMVFSSYGDGEDSNPNLTSAREFYFFPRTGALALEMNPAAGTVSVVMADGGRVSIDPATSQIASLERGSATVSPRVDPAERGGVEITSYAGLMLDAGFRMGESPSGRPKADSTFRDAFGHLCTVKNAEVFAYAGGEHELKHTDAELKAFLKVRCPNITPSF